MRNLVVGAQLLTMIALTVLFWKAGNHRLAAAQVCYCIATVFLFAGVK